MTVVTESGLSEDLKEPQRVSGGEGEHGHLDELATDPIALFWRIRNECGDVGKFQLADREVVLVTGAQANEEFFRAPDEVLDQAAAYPFMTPVFGEGVVFDTSPEERSKALHNQALKGAHMKQHAVTIPNEVERMIANWGEEGEIDLLEFFGELTLYTSSACLIGVSSGSRCPSGSPGSTTTSNAAPTRWPTSTTTPTSRASAAATPPAPNSSSSWPRS